MSPLDSVDGCNESQGKGRNQGSLWDGLEHKQDPYVPSQNKRATAPWSAGDRVFFVFYPSELQRASAWQLEQQLLKMQKRIFFNYNTYLVTVYEMSMYAKIWAYNFFLFVSLLLVNLQRVL